MFGKIPPLAFVIDGAAEFKDTVFDTATVCSQLVWIMSRASFRASFRASNKKRQVNERSFQSAPQRSSQRTCRSEMNFPGNVCLGAHALQSLIILP